VHKESKSVGLVVLRVSVVNPSLTELVRMIEENSELVPGGRCFAIIWDLGATISKGLPLESIATDTLMGAARSRTAPNSSLTAHADDDWSLFGTLAVRSMQDSCTVGAYKSVIIFRKAGPRTFERRHSASPELLQTSRIDVEAKAFTRDFANNVWHFSGRDVETMIAQRLSYLMTWHDEVTIIADQESRLHEQRRAPEMEAQQIPVADRESYYTGLTLFTDIEINRLT
jgi:hypothetical protein